MAWDKSLPELCAAFDAALPRDARVQRRQMFGYPCAFANGHMFCGLFQQHVHVRLDPTQRARALALPQARVFEPMPGRAMKEYVCLPPAVIAAPAELQQWLARGLEYVSALPPKAKPAAKRRPTARG